MQTKNTQMYSYIPLASPQLPWYLAKLRNAWIALITPPNKLYVQVMNEAADKLEGFTEDVESGKIPLTFFSKIDKRCEHDWCFEGETSDHKSATFSCSLCGEIHTVTKEN